MAGLLLTFLILMIHEFELQCYLLSSEALPSIRLLPSIQIQQYP